VDALRWSGRRIQGNRNRSITKMKLRMTIIPIRIPTTISCVCCSIKGDDDDDDDDDMLVLSIGSEVLRISSLRGIV